jgi:hypothetical protein
MRCPVMLTAILLAGATALAQPTTQPGHKRPSPPPGGRLERDRSDRPGMMPGMIEPISDSEWKEVSDFFAKHTPKRWEMLQKISDKERGGPLKRMITQRYRMIRRLDNDEDRDLYDNTLEQLGAEDAILTAGLKVKSNGGDQVAQSALRKAVTQLVDLRLRERELRIERIQQALTVESERLAADRENKDQMVEQWYQEAASGDFDFIRDIQKERPGPRGDRPDGPGGRGDRPDGPGPRGDGPRGKPDK